ncbi:MAG: MFS transporter [Lachnospiraceae bacterium]|nr:MFS transporter [Lachnospiraceae bacterium]
MVKRSMKPAVIAYMAFLLFGSFLSIVSSYFNILASHFSHSLSSISLMLSAMATGRILTIFISGFIADRIGRKLMLFASISCVTVFFVFVPFTTNFTIALMLSAIAGMGHGMTDSSATALVLDCFPDKPNFPLSLIQVFFCVGAMSTPIAADVLFSNGIYFGWGFWGLGVLGIVAAFLILTAKFPPYIKDKAEIDTLIQNKFNVKPSVYREGLLIGLIVFFYSITTTTLTTWGGTYAMEAVGIEPIKSIHVLTYYNIGCMTGTFIIAKLLDRIHSTVFIILNPVMIILFMFLFYTLKSPGLSYMLFMGSGLFAGIFYSLALSVVDEMFPEKKASASGVTMGMSALGSFCTPVITGRIYESYGIANAFGIMFISFILLFVLSIVFRLRFKKILNKSISYSE